MHTQSSWLSGRILDVSPLIFFIITFSPITPIIVLPGMIYFSIRHLVDSYNLLVVHKQEMQCYGKIVTHYFRELLNNYTFLCVIGCSNLRLVAGNLWSCSVHVLCVIYPFRTLCRRDFESVSYGDYDLHGCGDCKTNIH